MTRTGQDMVIVVKSESREGRDDAISAVKDCAMRNTRRNDQPVHLVGVVGCRAPALTIRVARRTNLGSI